MIITISTFARRVERPEQGNSGGRGDSEVRVLRERKSERNESNP